jgi:hypothetical protein
MISEGVSAEDYPRAYQGVSGVVRFVEIDSSNSSSYYVTVEVKNCDTLTIELTVYDLLPFGIKNIGELIGRSCIVRVLPTKAVLVHVYPLDME